MKAKNSHTLGKVVSITKLRPTMIEETERGRWPDLDKLLNNFGIYSQFSFKKRALNYQYQTIL